MSEKYIFRMAEEGYLTQKNISLGFLKCMGVRVEFWESEWEYPPDMFPNEKGELPNSILRSLDPVSLEGVLSSWCGLRWGKSLTVLWAVATNPKPCSIMSVT